jgi:transcriptional regulator with PAS, ATPase and Fis domain
VVVTDTRPRLIAIAGPSLGAVLPLKRATTLGRESTSDYAIGDAAMSRRHCTIDPRDTGWVVVDLDSRNGTLVNGVPIRAHTLANGDQIRVGDSVFLFAAGDGRDAESIPAESTTGAALVLDPPSGGQVTFTTEQQIRHDLVGQSPAMVDVITRIGRAAAVPSTVLIQGESGTGKELIARAIHANSARAAAPFVAINCAAIPDGLIESELFGHERGAFTGALAQKRGRLEVASGGTVFFDEISELSVSLQAKLLRVLQERQIDRVGGSKPIPIDVRVLAASNLELARAVKDGAFRSDLFYRLNVITITVPPLRERTGDIALLIWYFLRKHAGHCKRRLRGLTPQARRILTSYDWPGNVRELENAIERAVVMSTDDWIDVNDLPEHVLESTSKQDEGDGYHGRINHAKRETIRKALEAAGGNVAQAARQLKLQPTYLHRLIKNLGLRDEGA